MQESINLIFQSLKDKEITEDKAKEHITNLVKDNAYYVSIGRREIALGEALNFPLMKFKTDVPCKHCKN